MVTYFPIILNIVIIFLLVITMAMVIISSPKSKFVKRFPKAAIFIGGAGVVSYTILMIIVFSLTNNLEFDSEADISSRISTISNNLLEMSQELSKLQKELETRIKYVDHLKEEAEIAENVISLSEEQVNAVQAKLNQELESSSGRDILISVVIGAIFYILGVVTPMIINKFKNKEYIQKQNPTINERTYSTEDMSKMLDKLKEYIEKDKT